MKEVYIVAASRTPIGSFLGAFSTVSATDLGAVAIESAIQKSGLGKEDIDEVFMGMYYKQG